MKNIRINLLPWRTERRIYRKEQFKKINMLAVVLGFVMSGLVYLVVQREISLQEERNAFLEINIKKYDDVERKMRERAEVLNSLVERMKAIITLQVQRTKAIKEMEVLASSLPENTFLSSIDMEKNNFHLSGVTTFQNSQGVSQLIYMLKNSDQFNEPVLKIVQDGNVNGTELRSFSMDALAK